MKSSVKALKDASICVNMTSAAFISTYEASGGYTRGGVAIIRGKRVVELRLAAGFETQQKLAAKAKIDPSKLSRLENDKPVNLTLKTVERLAKTLKVQPRELFNDPRPDGDAGHAESIGGVGGGAGLADSLRRALAEFEQTGQFPRDWRGDIMLAIFTLTRALQRQTTAGGIEGADREAQR